ncbi:MAG: hypothetical protein KBG15_03755 [Kofleriaceae bacterium]|nr:hypothetical protein [Kofleriaceae bacterium]
MKMRVSKLFPVLVLAAACGDSRIGVDARVRIDAPRFDGNIVDGRVDGGVDGGLLDAANPDAPLSTVTRVWVMGDLAVNNELRAGTFTDGDTLPVTPTLIPATGNLSSNGKSFDASANGTKIAYIADSTVAGRFDLFLANADGSNPVTVLEAPTGVILSSVLFSPDGTKIAYLADPALPGMKDLFMVPATANATPVQLSPARVTNLATLDVASSFVWSANSKYIGYIAEIAADTFNEALVVDTSVATPVSAFVIPRTDIATQTAGGLQGTSGFAAFDNAGHVFFRAKLADAGQFILYRANVDGTARAAQTFAPARGDASIADFGAFATTADGTKMVFAVDAPTLGTYQLYSVTLATPTPVKMTAATNANTEPAFNIPLMISPDGTKVAFAADYESNGDFEPHVAKLDGTGDLRLADVTVMSTDTEALAWTRDGSAVYCQGDLLVNNDTRIFRLAANTADQALIGALAGMPAVSADVEFVFTVPKP